ncbi:WYL domain-containing transcriptional regulator [Helicobacter sp. MIT 05-5293]|uniref:helix-turn-helix transcriptional regulator n=1 Tax=Helicobacter sp. MIT 05-5293 TaxID=1548149 RepID=UPI00051D7120|nr:WYL domain-containing transcriptional regulator [Helicobacter sp. MIT 05-5293]TLD82098.1 WYL domain-containing transcriptional regulator [Helicobacter sp. MIT 05-5293]
MARHEYEQKLARMQRIMTLLYDPANNSVICAKALAEEFNVSTRTLRRDVEMMGDAYQYHRDKIYFYDNKVSQQPQASPIALMLLKNFAQSMSGEIKTQMLSILNSLESSPAHQASDIFFTRSHLEEITLSLDSILLLQKAIKEHIIIGFKFKKDSGYTEREVLPLKILNFSGEWYMLGLESSSIKKFYLNNISNVHTIRQGESIDEEALGRLDNALNAWFVPNRKPFMVRLWVDSKVAKYFKRKKISPNQHLIEHSDKSLDITLYITDFREIAPLVLMWIPSVVVLEPQELKEFILKNVRDYLKLLES